MVREDAMQAPCIAWEKWRSCLIREDMFRNLQEDKVLFMSVCLLGLKG